jgi:MYXO-CTERM domain-containing protein
MTRTSTIAIGLAAIASIAGSAQAAIFTLEDGNSSASVDTNSVGGNRPGMQSWFVDGTNHLFSQWFWYRVGNSGPEQRINSLPILGQFSSNTNFDPRHDTMSVLYGNSSFTIEIRFTLRGGSAGSNRADIAEQIRITNNTNSALPMSFFQYSDFDLNSDINDDFVGILGPNVVQQADFSSGLAISETVVTPPANNWEVNTYPVTIGRLDDGNTDNLNGNGGPLVGRADYTWAYQWNINIPARRTFIISKDKSLTPAPGALALLGLGGLAMSRRRR